MDDMGSSHAANAAGVDLFEKGIVTSCSVMIPGAYAYDFIRWWKDNQQFDTGIHFTLTCEWENGKWRPVGDFTGTKSLWSPLQFMWQTNNEVIDHATPDDVYHELNAQIRLALKWGLKPSHVDRHMYTVTLKDEFAQIYLRLAQQYDVSYLLHTNEVMPKSNYIPPGCNDSTRIGHNEVIRPVKSIDHQVGVPYDENMSLQHKQDVLYDTIRNIKPGITLLTLHPVVDSPEIRYIIPDWKHRHDEYLIFMKDETLDVIKETGIDLIDYTFI